MNKKSMPIKLFLRQLIVAFVLFSLSQIVLMLISSFTGYNYFNPSTWHRWDSGHYIAIAETGYELFPCAGKFGYPEDSTATCGNTGWFPGYPLLIQLFTFNIIDTITVASVLSKIFFFLSLFLVVKITDINKINISNILLLSIPTFWFGNIYYSAIFPVSTVLFFTLSALYFFLKEKMWISGLFCFLASFTYPTGFLISLVIAFTILLRKNESLREKFCKLSVPIIMGIAGVLFVYFIFQISVNDWAAFFKVQEKYHHTLQNPVSKMYVFFKLDAFRAFSLNNFIQYQSFLVLSGYVLICFQFIKKLMFRNELYLWTFIYVTLFLFFPWTVGGVLSMYRAESLLLPFVFLLKGVRTFYITGISICLISIGIPMSYLFFKGILI